MADGEAKPGYGPLDDDDCAMCYGSGEINVPKLDEYETAVIDGTGRHLQERIEAALGIGN